MQFCYNALNKHPKSPMMNPHPNFKNGLFFITAILIMVIPAMARGQMFSVKSNKKQVTEPNIGIYAGASLINFNYKGAENAGPAAGMYAFNGPIIRFRVEGQGIELYLGTGGNITGLDPISYFDAGIRGGYGLLLYHVPKLDIKIPLQVHAGLTSVANDEILNPIAPDFQQGTFSFGTGVDISARPAPRFHVKANLKPSYGFTFSTRQRHSSGGVFGVEGKVRFYLIQLFGSAGLSLGYGYRYRHFNIEGQQLDYNAMANSFLIGIIF
jgi:hypothetical protein